MFLNRLLAVSLRRAALAGTPVLLHGPRGAGKTTLARRELAGHLYIHLEDAADRAAARRDPALFLARLRRPAIVDEIERAPELVEHLRNAAVDLPVIFLSSLRLDLPMETFELHPPTRAEREQRPPLPLELLGHFAPATPAVAGERGAAAIEWPRTREFLHRDLPLLVRPHEPDRIERLLELLQQRSGWLLDQQALARELAVAHRTVARWLAALDACFLTLRLDPLEMSFGRRVVRRPKLHVPDASECLETAVVAEIYRNARHLGLSPKLNYWRDSNGLEIPLIVRLEAGAAPAPVVITRWHNSADEARLARWMRLAGVRGGAVIAERPLPGSSPFQGVLRYHQAQL